MTIEIRPPGADELRAAMEAAEGAFGSELEDHDWEREQKILPPSRALAAYDGEQGGRARGRLRVRPLDPGR